MWIFAYKKTFERPFSWIMKWTENYTTSNSMIKSDEINAEGSSIVKPVLSISIPNSSTSFVLDNPSSLNPLSSDYGNASSLSTGSDSSQRIPELEEIANEYMNVVNFPVSELEKPKESLPIQSIHDQDYDEYYTPSERSLYEVTITTQTLAARSSPIRWQKGCLLGYGSFGKVFLGLNIYSGDFMAIKQVALQSENAEYSAEVQSLQQEISLLQTLNHENIVQYIGSSVENSYFNIFLEYVSGGSIASIIKRFGKINEILTKKYTKQILNGLKYLHDRKIIHRDIKGENILVDNRGVIKLSDFGAAKRLEGLLNKGGGKGISSFKGTIYWMAPEVLRQIDYGRQADIWSLGCTVLEMITGIPPWSDEFKEQATALFKIASKNQGPKIPEDLSLEGKDFLSLCFKLVPKDRPHARKLLQHPWIDGVSSAPLTPGQYAPPDPFPTNHTPIKTPTVNSFTNENPPDAFVPVENKLRRVSTKSQPPTLLNSHQPTIPPKPVTSVSPPLTSLSPYSFIPEESTPESDWENLINEINQLAVSPDVPGLTGNSNTIIEQSPNIEILHSYELDNDLIDDLYMDQYHNSQENMQSLNPLGVDFDADRTYAY